MSSKYSTSYLRTDFLAQAQLGVAAAQRETMAAQETDHYFDTVSDEGKTTAVASTEPPPQTTQPQAPWLIPEPPLILLLEEYIEREEIRMATIASLALAREAEEIRIATSASLEVAESAMARPPKAPPSTALPKAPPPELLHHFRCLADDNTPARAPWPRNSQPPPCTSNGEPAPPAPPPPLPKSPPPSLPRNEEPEEDAALPLETSSPAQSEQGTAAPQGPASTAQEEQAPRPAINARPAIGPWSNYTEVGDVFYQDTFNQQRTRDVRLPKEVKYRWLDHPLPRVHLWAFTCFEDPSITTEKLFLKAWFTAAYHHDHGIRRIWKQYCDVRGDGTQDPCRNAPIFSRIFFYLHCSMEENFFTQHPKATLLPLWKEEQLVQEGAAEFEATHVHYRPPRINWPPEEVFTSQAEVQETQSNARGAHWPCSFSCPNGPAQHFAEQRQQLSAPAEVPWQHGAAASSWQGTQQWWQSQQGNWDWTPQQGGWGSGWQWP